MSEAAQRDAALVVDVLGAGSGHPTAARDTSSLLIGGRGHWTLVDCPGAIVHKLARRGLEPTAIARVVLTHNHVDHVYGLPHLLHSLAIMGETGVLPLFAPAQTLETVAAMVQLHRLDGPRYPTLQQHAVALEEGVELSSADGTAIHAAPARHGRETIALRFSAGTAAACYSADTRPSEGVAGLAADADLLLHDCAGPHRMRDAFGGDHSSAREAAEVAAQAGVGRLALMHLGVREEALLDECLVEARSTFDGEVVLARDGMRFYLGDPPESRR